MIANLVFQVSVAAVLVLLGLDAWRRPAAYCPRAVTGDERDRRVKVVRRGAVACQGAGVVFLLMVVPFAAR